MLPNSFESSHSGNAAVWSFKSETSCSSSSMVSGSLNNFKRKSISAAVVQGIVALGTFGVHFEEAYSKWARKSKDNKLRWTTACCGGSQYRLNAPSELCPCCPFWSFMLRDRRLHNDLSMESDKWLGIHDPAGFQLTAVYFSISRVARFIHVAYHLKSCKVNKPLLAVLARVPSDQGLEE